LSACIEQRIHAPGEPGAFSSPMPIKLRSSSVCNDPIPVIARVDCRSEGRGEEIPVAVVFGNKRLEIVDVLDRAMITSVEAGDPVRHRLWVELEDGQRCKLTRVMPDGAWVVKVAR